MAIVLSVSDLQVDLGFKEGTRGIIKLPDLAWARKSLSEGYALGAAVRSAKSVLKTADVIYVERLKEGEARYGLRQMPLVQGALIAMDPHTGRILAMQGGWKYSYGQQFNRATQAQRQPGSAFKPFVYLAALEKGLTPATLVLDAPFVIEDRPGNFWSPTNYKDKYYGPTPIRVGVEKSRNLMTVRLADHLGMAVVSEYAQRFGIIEHMPPLLAHSLGAGETSLLNLTAAYGMLVNGGKKIAPSLVDRIQDRRGQTIFRHDARPCLNCGALTKWQGQTAPLIPDTRAQLVDSGIAYQMVSILDGVVQRGTGIRIKDLNRPLAGKTGTTNESKDAWFIGFSPDLVVGVYTGFDEPRSLGKRETGSSVAVPIFKAFMQEALKDTPLTPFRIPPGIRHVQINAATGQRANPGDQRVIWEAFVAGTEPSDEMYILDEAGGVSLMPSMGTGLYDYEGAYSARSSESNVFVEPAAPPPKITSGTGGLY